MKFLVHKSSGDVEVLLLPFKGTNSFSFVNLTRGHICPCVFDSVEDALRDMEGRKSRGLLDGYDVIEPKSNDPLTLDELQRMNGEPVWVIMEQDGKTPFKAYGIVSADIECVLGIEFVLQFEDYGEWLAYRRKPEACHDN